MIQEILGYCLIKKQLIEEPEMQILIDVSERKSLINWLHYLESKKRKICEEWLEDEISSRKIPTTKPEVDIKTILGYIASDFDNLCTLLNSNGQSMEKGDSLSYLSTISWTANQHPELFDTKDELTIGNASNLLPLESGNNFLERALSIISYFLEQIPEEIDFSLRESLAGVQSQLDKMNESLTQFGKVNY